MKGSGPAPSQGSGPQEIATYPALTCQAGCPAFTPAEIASSANAEYDSAKMSAHEEGAVDVSFTIGTDGHVKNPLVEQVVGSRDFIKPVTDALARFVYRPATEDGKPVEQNQRLRFFFMPTQYNFEESRPSTDEPYKEALAKQSDPAAAIAALKAIEDKGGLNLHESAMVSAALAQIEAKAGNYDAAARDSKKAVVSGGKFLSAENSDPVMRLNIVLEARAGQYADAFSTFDALSHSGARDIDSETKLVAQLHAQVASAQPLWASAKIGDGAAPVWTHTMLRRSFGFANVKGTLSQFHLRCEAHGIDAAVNDTATWTIPATWSSCNILVEGAPGTTFQFGEAQAPAAGAPPSHS